MGMFYDCSELRDLQQTSTQVTSRGPDASLNQHGVHLLWSMKLYPSLLLPNQSFIGQFNESQALVVAAFSPVQRRISRRHYTWLISCFHTLFTQTFILSLQPLTPPSHPLASPPSIHPSHIPLIIPPHSPPNYSPSSHSVRYHVCHLHPPRTHDVIRECLQVLAECLRIQSHRLRSASFTDPLQGEHKHQCAWQTRTGNPLNGAHPSII